MIGLIIVAMEDGLIDELPLLINSCNGSCHSNDLLFPALEVLATPSCTTPAGVHGHIDVVSPSSESDFPCAVLPIIRSAEADALSTGCVSPMITSSEVNVLLRYVAIVVTCVAFIVCAQRDTNLNSKSTSVDGGEECGEFLASASGISSSRPKKFCLNTIIT